MIYDGQHRMPPSAAACPDDLTAWQCLRCSQWIPEVGARPPCNGVWWDNDKHPGSDRLAQMRDGR